MTYRAAALFSGGLDSTLAILSVLRQGVAVKAVKFQLPFDCGNSSEELVSVSERFGFGFEIRNLGEKFLDTVKNPEHGYGKNMNPCIDCRIAMLREARALIDSSEADFIITGEVIGQRPMSQRKDILYHIDKKAGVTNLVVRPLSARLLRVTIPEAAGIISKKTLYGFSGRSRKPQMALAEEFGLRGYPSPAGGCLLTEPNYAYKLKDLLVHDHSPTMRAVELLRTGRHFRPSPLCKIVIGRNQAENALIESLAAEEDVLLKVDGWGSPITLVSGEITCGDVNIAASLCARYSDARNSPDVYVTGVKGADKFILKVLPAGDGLIDGLRIEKRKAEKIKTALQISL